MQTALDALDEEIATLAAQLNVVTYRLLSKIHAFDVGEGWGAQGYSSCAHYLSFRIGLSLGAAREHVRVAHALAELPQLSAAMESGALSYSKARALSRIAKPETERDLLAMADDVSAAALEKIVSGYRRAETADSALEREHARTLSYFVDADGMVVFNARLLAEEGALLVKALEAARARKGKTQVDAFVELVERSLANAGAEAASSAERHQVIVHVDAETLRDGDGRAEVGGVGVSEETCRRLCCDASVVTMTHDKDGNVVDTGRKTRTVSTPLRRKLKERDGHACRFPGCSNRHTDAHHVQHWSRGGATTLDNLVSLCRTHHRYVHELGFSVDDHLVFRDKNGRVIPNVPAKLTPTGNLAPVAPRAMPPMPRYVGAEIDYGYVVSSLLYEAERVRRTDPARRPAPGSERS